MLDAADEAGLLARIAEVAPPPPAAEADPVVLAFAGYRLDLAGRCLINAEGADVPLTRGEFGLLQAFVQRPGRALSRDYLLQVLAGREAAPVAGATRGDAVNPCRICPHPRRAEAEAMLAAASLAHAAAAIGVTKPALHRHWTRHGPNAEVKRDDAVMLTEAGPRAATAKPLRLPPEPLWSHPAAAQSPVRPGMGRCFCSTCSGLRGHYEAPP